MFSLQALWRGHCSRRLNDNPKVVKLRHRLRQVSADVKEEDKLCNKTTSALDYLLRYKQFSYILEALKNLGKPPISNYSWKRLDEGAVINLYALRKRSIKYTKFINEQGLNTVLLRQTAQYVKGVPHFGQTCQTITKVLL